MQDAYQPAASQDAGNGTAQIELAETAGAPQALSDLESHFGLGAIDEGTNKQRKCSKLAFFFAIAAAFVVAGILAYLVQSEVRQLAGTQRVVARVAFGSCTQRYNGPNSIWQQVRHAWRSAAPGQQAQTQDLPCIVATHALACPGLCSACATSALHCSPRCTYFHHRERTCRNTAPQVPQAIIPSAPDAWVWLGDMAYMDMPVFECTDDLEDSPACSCERTIFSHPPHNCFAGDVQNAQRKLEGILHSAGYNAFLQFMCPGFQAQGRFPPQGGNSSVCPRPVLGVWDDHDSGGNNVNGRQLANRAAIKQVRRGTPCSCRSASRSSQQSSLLSHVPLCMCQPAHLL